ncbi:MAG TPA: voltage-gated chloride channel family protein, partial [Tepidiformaceae bacterium]|nr:voltage-gated chloride channel family protein [Tepidiformaceae bacterium]
MSHEMNPHETPVPRPAGLVRTALLLADAAGHTASVRYLVRWALLLTPLVLLVGSACALFLWSLDEVTATRQDNGWIILFLPVAGIVVVGMYRWLGKDVEAGNNLIIDHIHQPGAGVPARMAPLIFIGTVVTHLFGGSAGREGTAVQLGGGIAGGLNRFLRLSPDELRTFLMAGVAAGFGAVFGTPLAGAIFAMEVLALGRMEYSALIPVLFASLGADYVTGAWDIGHTQYTVASPESGASTLPFDLWLMAKAAAAGVVFGLVALAFAELTHELARLFRRFIRHPLLRPAAGGLLVIALAGAVGTTAYLGLGVTNPGDQTSIVSSFQDGGAAPFAWAWKILFTVITLASGFKGGEVTPLFFIGASLGNVLADLLSAPTDLFAALGFVAVFAGAANTPLACTVMGVELFGAESGPYLAVTCFVSYFVSGHRGIYLSQRVGTPK